MVPLMALIVHVGLMTLTRRQMQTAVNTAALEGLRFRDDTITESEKRDQVSELVETVFDDDLDPSNGQGSYRLGIGPDVQFDGGIELPGTDFRASARITTARPFWPAPLEPNLGNELRGDMVAGRYLANDTIHDEEANYVRTDFDLNGDDAFLVRMR
ncbi:MAG: hypothetical protein KDA84_29460, partial [Planctomycetaceae bacterium]|nr:hypothetical protein [Planctomycetaceae bacterium]